MRFLSAPFWYLGRIRYSNQMFRSLAALLHQAVDALCKPQPQSAGSRPGQHAVGRDCRRKPGLSGSPFPKTGERPLLRDFQREVKALQRTGVLLAICSKNNPGDLDGSSIGNPMMILRREDFACIRANWEPKPQNLLEIAETLNLGVDSFVFIDDNPVEREMVATAVARRCGPSFFRSASKIFRPGSCAILFRLGSADMPSLRKTAIRPLNIAQMKNADSSRALLDLDAFLRDLEIECTFHIDPVEQIARVAQLTQKTTSSISPRAVMSFPTSAVFSKAPITRWFCLNIRTGSVLRVPSDWRSWITRRAASTRF